jgi:hypothetical protein
VEGSRGTLQAFVCWDWGQPRCRSGALTPRQLVRCIGNITAFGCSVFICGIFLNCQICFF